MSKWIGSLAVASFLTVTAPVARAAPAISDPSMMTDVTDGSFQDNVLSAKVPVVVFFWADWCDPCKKLQPALEEIAKEYDGKIKFAKMNVDANPKIAVQIGIKSIPALVFYKDKKIVAQKIGAYPKAAVDTWIAAAASTN